jgi:hypothetical protein
MSRTVRVLHIRLMITLAQLNGAQRRTYQKIFHQPISTDVRRTAVRSLMETLGQVDDSGGDSIKVTRNGHILVLISPGVEKNESPDELVSLRHFLKRSESPQTASNGREAHLLLVMGHHEARLFRAEIYGGSPQQIFPHGNQDRFSLAASDRRSSFVHDAHADRDFYFEPIAEALRATGKILIFGESSTTQLEMDRFIGWLKRHHPDLSQRIIGSMVLNENQVNSNRLLAKAREFYAHTRPW